MIYPISKALKEAYIEGHIDHQLTLEASTEAIANKIKEDIDKRAGTSMSYTFNGRKILKLEHERIWQLALAAVPSKNIKKMNRVQILYAAGWNTARLKLLEAAKANGLEI